jgi:L-ascorbate metabolism protein UlaG (beta-lactamase superfamily)
MAAGSARIVYVGHATVLVEMDGVRLLTDPLLRGRLLHLRRVGEIAVEALGDVDAVLISHLHFDHLDLPSLRLLGRDVPIVVPRGAGALLARHGFGSVTELDIGVELSVGAVSVRGTPATHDARRLPLGARVEPMGHVISGSRAVYFAGDTDLFDEMEALGPVDVALLPIWGWGPSLGGGHMNPRQAAEAARRMQASIAIPIHWGTYFAFQAGLRGVPSFVASPAEEFSEHVRELAPDVEVRVLRPGDETVV